MSRSEHSVIVVGLGYVGFPLLVQLIRKGIPVAGFDVSPKIIHGLRNGELHITPDTWLRDAMSDLKQPITVSDTLDELCGSRTDTFIICVPTPTVHNEPDYSYVLSAAQKIAPWVRKGSAVFLESTVNPGVTRDLILPEILRQTGLLEGDFTLAHCPERIDPGNERFNVSNINRVVGGIDAQSTEAAQAFYASVIDAEVVALHSCEEAEFVKSWENSHRNVLIALANQAAIICDGLGMDIHSVLKGMQSKIDQFGLKLAQPGIGPGGHCIPEDIHYVIKKAKQYNLDTRVLDSAHQLNDHMPHYAVQKFCRLLEHHGISPRQAKVAVLGLAYKPNVADTRRSPSISVAKLLSHECGEVVVHDPHIQKLDTISELRFCSAQTNVTQALEEVDAVFIATPHAEYTDLHNSINANKGLKVVFDAGRIIDKTQLSNRLVFAGVGV